MRGVTGVKGASGRAAGEKGNRCEEGEGKQPGAAGLHFFAGFC